MEQRADGEQLDRGEPGRDRHVGAQVEERPERPPGDVFDDDVEDHVEGGEEQVDAEQPKIQPRWIDRKAEGVCGWGPARHGRRGIILQRRAGGVSGARLV